MIHPDFPFVDFAKGDVRARNNVVPIGEALAARENGAAVNSFVTVYRFPEAYVEHCRRFRSVSGYAGPCWADYLPIDIDRQNDLDDALRAARAVAFALHSHFELEPDQIRYFFSGAKGFHLLVPVPLMGNVQPSPHLPTAFRRMARSIAEMAGEQIDLKVYDVNRLFRLPNTQHPATRLWKVELTWDEFSRLDIEAIRQLARRPRDLKWQPHHLEPVDALAEFASKHLYEAEQDAKRPALSRLPSSGEGLASRIADVLSPYWTEGNRHTLALAFAGYAAKRSLPRETVLGVVALLAGGEEAEDRERAVSDTYDRIRAGLNVEGYSKLEELIDDDGLAVLKELLGDVPRRQDGAGHAAEAPETRISLSNVYDTERAGEAYWRQAKEMATRRVNMGVPTLDRLTRGLMPGTVTVVMAKARVGKSAFAQNVRRNIARNVRDGASVFFSLEMPVELVWERDAQYVFQLTGREIEEHMRDAEEDEARRWITQVSREIPRAYTVPQPGLSLADMEAYCRLVTDTFGHRIACVLIDYLSLVSAPGRDIYTSTTYVARGLKSFAKNIAAPVIMLAQVRRRGADGEKVDGSTPPTLEDVRDSGAVEEGADFVIGAWRPKIEAEYGDDTICFKLLKNRMGRAGVEVACRFDWRRLEIVELTPDPEPERYV